MSTDFFVCMCMCVCQQKWAQLPEERPGGFDLQSVLGGNFVDSFSPLAFKIDSYKLHHYSIVIRIVKYLLRIRFFSEVDSQSHH